MIWLRVIGWFFFLVLISCTVASGDETPKVIVEGFDEIYYMEDTGSVEISTEITFVGEYYDDGDIPIEVFFYGDGKILLEEKVSSNKVRTQVHENVYEYHKTYTDTFGFETDIPGEMELRVIVTLGNYQEFNEIFTFNINSGNNPSQNTMEEMSYGLIVIILIILIVVVIASIYGGRKIYERRNLASKSISSIDILPGDTELGMSAESETFKPIPSVRDMRVLKSKTSHSEIDMDEM